ncbi:MAG: TonB-dependent receptor domain-containing protein [Gemmatimonadaceae bacterium]
MSRRSLYRALAFALVVIPSAAGAQDARTVTGRVRGESGEPLQGATVTASGTTRLAVTRDDGTYRLVLPPGRYELRARLVGYAAVRESVTVAPRGPSRGVEVVQASEAAGNTLNRDFQLARAVTTLDAVAVLGTRGEERTVVSAPVPIDVLSSVEIRQMGRVETAQAIQAVAPSFNFPRTSVADGTDHIRPATLRGLAPDQTLVLVNGKRRHTSALVNVNGTIGRGSAAVDLNAIPASMIERVEILRDGAAAQYGSDAIAGVINIVLKRNAPGEITSTIGQHFTTYNRADASPQPAVIAGARTARDGELLQVAANRGFSFGSSGYVFVGGELRDRGETNRSLPDPRQQYFTGDPRNSQPPRINHRQGDGYMHDLGGFFNAGSSTAKFGGADFYAFGGLSRRFGDAAGFWRRPLDDRTVRAIYPDGFLPVIQSEIWDGSMAAGVKGAIRGWHWDLSNTFGSNSFAFGVTNSANVSLGAASPTRFEAGRLAFRQNSLNLDILREIAAPWRAPIKVAVGSEFRYEQYQIKAGEPASYQLGPVPILNPDNTPKIDPVTGQPAIASAGAQVFPGFRPTDALREGRHNLAGYIDLESHVLPALLVSLAGRYEDYSDFGSTTNGKIAARVEVNDKLALRGAASTGFRAPSLHQQYFSSTATNFIGGRPFDIRTFPVRSTEAQILGARPLTPEKSKNFSAGLAFEPTRALSLTIDHYEIKIDDRIVFSENFTDPKIRQLFIQRGLTEVTGGRFFTNAIDTRTRGIDIIGNYGRRFPDGGVVRLTAGYNQSKTKVTRVTAPPSQLTGFGEQLFGRVERARIEVGQPRDNILLSGSYDWKQVGLILRTRRYGEVTSLGAPTATNLDQTFSARWITDVAASYTLPRQVRLTLGIDNLDDVYPDRNNNPGDYRTNSCGNANCGIFPYSGITPFGFNGRFVYVRMSAGL